MAQQPDTEPGMAELRAARRDHHGLLWSVGLFSVFVNLLQLTGPLYMLQIYDRVLASRSEETLVALSLLTACLFLAMAVLDHARARVLARIGAAIQGRLDARVFSAALHRRLLHPSDPTAATAQRDLESVQRLYASPLLTALFDMLWTPVFAAAIFLFHPALGWLAVAGGAVLIAATLLNQRLTQAPQNRAITLGQQADQVSDQIRAESETVLALGMTGAAFARWQALRATALADAITAADLAGTFGSAIKTFRLFLQSTMLGLGAWLVLQGQISGGVMVAASILMGRALAPVELAMSQWATALRAQEGMQRLALLLSQHPPPPPHLTLPHPKAVVEVQNLTVTAPESAQAVLRMISFALHPGQALGVIGPSGAGKSSLARALIGVWPAAAGKVRLDGATLDQYDPDALGSYIGYLPQRVALFDGTIAENIARLAPRPDSARVVQAAQRAAAHDMILRLPDGYDTRVSALGGRLSGGQIQRIGLARALYGDPVLLVLDEPNSNLDNDGTLALNQAIRAVKSAGGAVLIMAHRPAAIQECDLLLVLEDGLRRGFGPRDQILREMVRNHTDLARTTGVA